MKNFLRKNKINPQAGMTYVELIVVLSIFAIMSTVILFDYKSFQAKVDIKNLASEVALKFSQAQKYSVSGQLPLIATDASWKPSYGIFLDLTNPPPVTTFKFFVDLDGDDQYDEVLETCGGGDECLEETIIGRGNSITAVKTVTVGGSESDASGDLNITYERPASIATFSCGGCDSSTNSIRFYVTSPAGPEAVVEVYASGRIEID